MIPNSAQFEKFVAHWAPQLDEPFEIRLCRAFLNATACVESQREVIAGNRPLRPLESFPQTTYPEGGIGL